MKRENADKERTICGIVTPANWDKDFNIISLKISAHDEQEFLVDPKGKGKELHEYMREYLKVTGRIRGYMKGKGILEVTKYEKVPP